MAKSSPVSTIYIPSDEESAARTELYKELQFMRQLKDKKMPHFSGPNGQRSWNDLLDDSESIVNIFTPAREDSGKQDWQSNSNIGGAEVRAKMRAVAAGIGLQVPQMAFTATDENGIRSVKRAEIFKNIVRSSYEQKNISLQSFLEAWQMLAHGVIFEYEGYKTGGGMQEVVESFDTVTGQVKTRKEYVKMDGKPVNILLNPQEFFWKTFFVNDIQEQPKVAWVQHYTKREVEMEFSKYPNYKYVQDKSEAKGLLAMNDSAFMQAWSERVEENNDYEVVRMYSKEDDGSDGKLKGYEVWVNGIPMLRAPLLWGEKEKVYPFAKQVPETYANTKFFVGVPFPILLEGYTENKNMLLNSLVDKVARGLDPLKLVSLGNRDLLDVESEIHTEDSTIYVPDVNGVKFMEHPQVNQGEIVLLNLLSQGMQLVSIDNSQQGISSGTKKTAREAVIANQKAEELKGNLFLSLEDLWYQKTSLRVSVVLTHYIKDKAAADSIKGQTITVKNYTFGDGTRGTLEIHVAKTKAKLLSQQEIEAREEAMKKQGENYKIVSMLSSYLDDWIYDFSIVPQSLRNQDRLQKEDDVMGEIEAVIKLFPQFFAANQAKYLSDVLEIRGHHIDEYQQPQPQPPKPSGKVSESINYKDAPPDIQRQMEEQAGFKPSQAQPEATPQNPASPQSPTAPNPTPAGKPSLADMLARLKQ